MFQRYRGIITLASVVGMLLYGTASATSTTDAPSGIQVAMQQWIENGGSIGEFINSSVNPDSTDAGEYVLAAASAFPDSAGSIVTAALNSGVSIEIVIKSAIAGAPSKSSEIIAAALRLFPDLEKIIALIAQNSGANGPDISAGIVMGRLAILSDVRLGIVSGEGVFSPPAGRGGVFPPKGDGVFSPN